MPFKKGQSGNPGGRPKVAAELKARCLKAVDEKVIKAWIAEIDAMGDHWVKCSELLAAYGLGKPTQPISGEDSGPIKVAVQTYRIPDNGRDK